MGVRPESTLSVPVVDLAQRDAPIGLDAAFRDCGFVQIVGHGVTGTSALWSAMDDLFAQPTAIKETWVCDDPLANRGYRQRGSEALAYSLGADGSEAAQAPPDLFESFNLRLDDRARSANGETATTTDRLFAANRWPEHPAGFRPAAEAYLAEMVTLSSRLDAILGPLIGVEDLASRSRRGPDAMACIRYQHNRDEDRPRPGQSRMGAHSDYTTFTVLNADPVPGLQILTGDGWFDVIPEPGALLVNVGDLLAIWTNDRWPSTVHRVPLRGSGDDPVLRRSVAYFHYPDPHVVVEPIAGPLAKTGGTARYTPTTVAEHLERKLVGPKLQRRSEGQTTLGGRSLDRSP